MTADAAPPASALVLPLVESADLTGRRRVLPRNLESDRTIVILAFTQDQQHEVDAWIEGLQLKPDAKNWLEIPVIDQPGPIGRFFIDNGMRRGISSIALRQHVITLYTDKRAFLSSVGVTSDKAVTVMVVDRNGAIRVKADGAFDSAKAHAIASAAFDKNTANQPYPKPTSAAEVSTTLAAATGAIASRAALEAVFRPS